MACLRPATTNVASGAAGCSPCTSPGNAERCRDFFTGKIKRSEADVQTHDGARARTVAEEVMNNPSFM